MSSVQTLFATRLYRAALGETAFNAELEAACRMLAAEDRAGQAWCRCRGYGGYTSYASLNDLTTRASVFDVLRRRLDKHVAAFAEATAFELGPRGRLKLDSLWVNLLKPGAGHSGHIHPHSVVSGTLYVALPQGAAGLKLEDPRLAMMMAAPPRRPDAPDELKAFVTLQPEVGEVLLWESWLRHEVPPTGGKGMRISVSFNYAWR